MQTLRKKLPEPIVKELQELKKYDAKILAALADKEMARLFYLDPGQALKKIGVPLSPRLEELLRKNRQTPATLKSKRYVLPSGQTITPIVNVRFRPAGGR